MKTQWTAGLCAAALATASMAAHSAGITFYEGNDFHGRAFSTNGKVGNFRSYGFNDKASSAIVDRGTWEVCEDANFSGHCVVLRGGNYDSLSRMGLNNQISSVRPADSRRNDYTYAGPPMDSQPYEWRRRPDERTYKVRVSSVHAVMGPPEQHCWVERQQVQERRSSGAGGAVAGAIIGGIIGHQFGSGRGNDVATVGGAVAGGAIGSNVARNNNGDRVSERDVRRCENTQDGNPDYWDVSYNFKGRMHYVQMSAPPGSYLQVNAKGEPRD